MFSPILAITPGRVKREATNIVFQPEFSEAGTSLRDRFCESKIIVSDFTENWALHTPWTLDERPHFQTNKLSNVRSLPLFLSKCMGSKDLCGFTDCTQHHSFFWTEERINFSEIAKISWLTRVSPAHSKSSLPSQLPVLLMPARGREGAHKLSDHQDCYMPILIQMMIMIADDHDDDHLAKMPLQVSHKTSTANTPHLMIMIMKPWSVWPDS